MSACPLHVPPPQRQGSVPAVPKSAAAAVLWPSSGARQGEPVPGSAGSQVPDIEVKSCHANLGFFHQSKWDLWFSDGIPRTKWWIRNWNTPKMPGTDSLAHSYGASTVVIFSICRTRIKEWGAHKVGFSSESGKVGSILMPSDDIHTEGCTKRNTSHKWLVRRTLIPSKSVSTSSKSFCFFEGPKHGINWNPKRASVPRLQSTTEVLQLGLAELLWNGGFLWNRLEIQFLFGKFVVKLLVLFRTI